MPSNLTTAVLLVGGKGTRMRPLTYHMPKPVVPLVNQPLLSYEFNLLAAHGITDVILAIGYKASLVEQKLGTGSRWNVNLTYVQEHQPLDTAGAIKNVEDHIDGHFVAMNGDLVYDVNLSGAIQAHFQDEAHVTFCLRKVKDISRFGLIQTDEGGLVTAFKEKQNTDDTGRDTVNSGTYIMSPQVFDHIPAGQSFSNEKQLFPQLLDAGKTLRGYLPEQQGYWADVGTIDAYLRTTKHLLGGAVPWTGADIPHKIEIQHDADICQPVNIDNDVTLHTGVTVGPNVTIGPDVSIGNNANVSNTIIWGNGRIGDNCHIDEAIITTGAEIPHQTHINEQVITRDRRYDFDDTGADQCAG